VALLTEICHSDRRRQIHFGKEDRRLVEERGDIQLLCFFQNTLMNHSVSCRESIHFMLNFRHLSIESPIQRNDLLSHPQFEAVRQSSSGPSAEVSPQRGQNLPFSGSPTAISSSRFSVARELRTPWKCLSSYFLIFISRHFTYNLGNVSVTLRPNSHNFLNQD